MREGSFVLVLSHSVLSASSVFLLIIVSHSRRRSPSVFSVRFLMFYRFTAACCCSLFFGLFAVLFVPGTLDI